MGRFLRAIKAYVSLDLSQMYMKGSGSFIEMSFSKCIRMIMTNYKVDFENGCRFRINLLCNQP